MNLAAPALLLVALILPGVIFRRKFREGIWESPPRRQSIAQQIVEGLLAAAVLHALWIWAAAYLFRPPDLELITRILLAGAVTDAEGQRLAEHIAPGAMYFTTIYAGSYLAGVGLHRAIRLLRFDVTFRIFRFDNPWYYILTGDPYGVPDQSESLFKTLITPRKSFHRWKTIYADSKRDREVFVLIQAVQEIGGTPYLYRGIVQEWYFDRDGNLDRLVLVEAARRPLANDEPSSGDDDEIYLDDERYYVLGTDYCVLHLNELRNISVDWWEVEDRSSARE